MTDPSPDCGYTEEELAQMDAEDANPGPNCVTPWEPDGLREAIAAYVAAVTDPDASESAVLESDQNVAAEIARLREFGEHYSGAAQDAWDRIVVLEAALREIMDLAGMTEGPYYPRAFSIAKAVLAAGSASPGGAVTSE